MVPVTSALTTFELVMINILTTNLFGMYTLYPRRRYRLILPMILHAGIFHYLLNMIALCFIGIPMERVHGFTFIASLFVISAVGGNILSAVFQPWVISVGASGGIFGLIGICWSDVIVNWDLMFLSVHGLEGKQNWCQMIQFWLWISVDTIINCLVGLTPYIDNFAHLGGLLYGIFFGLPLVDRMGLHFFGNLGSCFRMETYSFRLLGVLAGLLLLGISILMLIRSDGISSPCYSCRYISCIPSPWWEC